MYFSVYFNTLEYIGVSFSIFGDIGVRTFGFKSGFGYFQYNYVYLVNFYFVCICFAIWIFVLISVCSKDMKSSKPIENVFYYWKCLSQYEMIKNVLYILTVKCSPNYCNTSWYGCVVNLDYLDVFHLHSLHCRPLATKLSDMSLAAFQDICTITKIWI